MHHFYSAFEPIASEIIDIAAPGAMVTEYSKLPYKHINKKMWPLIEKN